MEAFRTSISVLSGNVVALAARVMPVLSGAFASFGAVIAATPIGWLIAGITAIAIVGVLIYKYWEPIKAFFSGFWDGLSSVAGPALQRWWDALKGFLSSASDLLSLIPGWGTIIVPVFKRIATLVGELFGWLWRLMAPVDSTTSAARNMGQVFGTIIGNIFALFASLPTGLLEIGKQMIDGFINGIMSRWATLKATVSELAAMLPEWMRKPLKINSPSRVFAEIGGYTMQGLEDGILGGKDGPLGAVSSMAKKIAGIGAGVAIGGAAMAGDIPIDMRPPMNTSAMLGAAAAPMQVTIHIYGAPGQDTGDIQRKVEQALENAEAKRAARSRSRLRDTE